MNNQINCEKINQDSYFSSSLVVAEEWGGGDWSKLKKVPANFPLSQQWIVATTQVYNVTPISLHF
jgi:hypothetical protein